MVTNFHTDSTFELSSVPCIVYQGGGSLFVVLSKVGCLHLSLQQQAVWKMKLKARQGMELAMVCMYVREIKSSCVIILRHVTCPVSVL